MLAVEENRGSSWTSVGLKIVCLFIRIQPKQVDTVTN